MIILKLGSVKEAEFIVSTSGCATWLSHWVYVANLCNSAIVNGIVLREAF